MEITDGRADPERRMDMEDKKREEELLKSIMDEETAIPPSLEPEAVEAMLKARKQKKSRKDRWRYAGIAAAACLCVAAGIAAGLGSGRNAADGGASGTAADRSSRGADGTQSAAASGGETGEKGAASGAGGADSAGAAKETSAADKVAYAEDYDEIYGYISEVKKARQEEAAAAEKSSTDTGGTWNGSAVTESAAVSDSASAGASSGSASGGSAAGYSGTADQSADGSYSDTNVREEGVGEADLVKTDGKTLYIVSSRGLSSVRIVGIGGEEMEDLGEIRLNEDCQVQELYLEDGRLAVLYSRTEYHDGETGYDGDYRSYTCTDVYDVGDPSEPELLGTISQSGYYNTMRVKDGYAYVISDFYADVGAAREDTAAYVPEVRGTLMSAADICLPVGRTGSQYAVISAVSLEDPSEKSDSKAVFGNAGMCYVSAGNIYVTESDYSNADGTQTSIRKVSCDGGKLEGAAQTKISGTLNDSFSIDEYNGYLRLVTTEEPGTGSGIMPLYGSGLLEAADDTTSNSLYILNEDLETVGEIRDLAKEERVYSARFLGDVGYFVTFKQVDPLFSVDLSDPEDPQIIGELKIPGFSEYLHPYGDGRLLGIGMDVDEEGVTTEGLKLSMFDVSDPADVKEISKLILEEMYGSDATGYNYKAVFIDVEKNLFGFVCYGNATEYRIFSYEEKEGFREEFSRELTGWGEVRGLYAGERFYLVAGNTVESYTLSGFEKLDDLVL